MGELATVLQRAAANFGSSAALIWKNTSYTFADLDARCGRLAGGLRNLGVERGSAVVLHLPNSVEWIVAYYAVARLGAVVVPANILLTPDEVSAICRDVNAAAIIGPSSVLGSITAKLGKQSNRLPTFVGLGASGAAPEFARFEALLEGEAMDAADVSDTDVQSIYYTSGTTDRSKGAVLTHGGVHASAAEGARMHDRVAGDTGLLTLPLSHVYGNFVLNAAVLTGMTMVLLDQFNPRATLGAIQQRRVTVFDGVPAAYHFMIADAQFATFDLGSLRICTIGGQPSPPERLIEIEDRLQCRLLQLWGMTELGGVGATQSISEPSPLSSIGRALPGLQTKIVNADGETVPAGVAGELLVKGAQVMQGYLGNREATDSTLQADGWMRTGDVAHTDDEGFLYIVDRKKDIIISSGYKIYPCEVENVLQSHEAVAAAAVVPVAHPARGEVPKAYVVLKHGRQVLETELLQHCRTRLATYKVPRQVEFIDQLPRTSSGKVMRRKVGEA